MGVRNQWAIVFPFIQYFIVIMVCVVAFMMICALDDASDIVMNAMAFGFIGEIGRYFNAPLSKHMSSTRIQGLDVDKYGDEEIFYLYDEYSESNAVYEDGTYSDSGWYILEEERKAGLLNDYK